MTTKKQDNLALAADHIAAAMTALGFDLSDENFTDTPRRFAKYLQEYLQPYNPESLLKIGFANGTKYHGMVAQANIPFRTICPHHLLPVMGTAAVAYIPADRVVGLSKLSRLVMAVGMEKPRMQEEVTDIIADILSEKLEARGAIVTISAIHSCMSGRGVGVANVPTITSSIRGVFRDVPQARDEFFQIIKSHHLLNK